MTLSLIEELELQVIALRDNSFFNCSLLVQRAIDALKAQEEEQTSFDLAVDNHARAMARVAELEREVERQNMNCLNLHQQLEDLKAQPSGAVPELRQVVTDALIGMIAAVTSSTPPANEPPPPFIQAAIDRAVDRIARLNSSPVSAGATVKQSLTAGGVDERVPELSSFVAFADALGLDLRQSDDQWNSALALYEKLIAAYPQPSAALSAPSHGEQVRAWNLAADALPACGKPVLAYYLNSHGMERRIRAMHVKRFTVEAEEFADPDTQCCEYSEQDDCYYTTEGWYELIDNWPDYASCAVIEGVITHWMPLPAAPSAGSQKEKGE